jgi:hypothetical protein
MKVDKLTLLVAAEFVDKTHIDESTVREAVEKAQRFTELARQSLAKGKAKKKDGKKSKPKKGKPKKKTSKSKKAKKQGADTPVAAA